MSRDLPAPSALTIRIVPTKPRELVEIKMPVLKKTVEIVKFRKANENKGDKGGD